MSKTTCMPHVNNPTRIIPSLFGTINCIPTEAQYSYSNNNDNSNGDDIVTEIRDVYRRGKTNGGDGFVGIFDGEPYGLEREKILLINLNRAI